MQTQFYKQLEAAVLEPLMVRSDSPALRRFALQYLQYGLFAMTRSATQKLH